MTPIPNDRLTLQDVPEPNAGWIDIMEFALTFDGYEYWGSLERCSDVAAARAHGTLTGLRTCLFFEQRLWRNGDETAPTKKTLRYWQSLIRQIRKKIQASPDLTTNAGEVEE